MAQERDERETAYGVAVQSLKNELRLAVSLLRQVKEAKEAIAGEPHIIGAARDEQLDRRRVTFISGPHQRCRAAQSFPGIDFRAVVEQNFDRLDVACEAMGICE